MRSDAFRSTVEAKDLGALAELCAEDVTFRSPVIYKPYQGREALGFVLAAVVRVLEGFHYVEQVETGDAAVLMFEAHAAGRDVQGVDILRFDEDGRIAELTVMLRPLSGINAVAERMREELEAAGAPAPGA